MQFSSTGLKQNNGIRYSGLKKAHLYRASVCPLVLTKPLNFD